MILRQALVLPEDFILCVSRDTGIPVKLLRVSKTWREIGRAILYGENTFYTWKRCLLKPFFRYLQSATISSIQHIAIDIAAINKTRILELKRCDRLKSLLILNLKSLDSWPVFHDSTSPSPSPSPSPSTTSGISTCEADLRQTLIRDTVSFHRCQFFQTDTFRHVEVRVSSGYCKLKESQSDRDSGEWHTVCFELRFNGDSATEIELLNAQDELVKFLGT